MVFNTQRIVWPRLDLIVLLIASKITQESLHTFLKLSPLSFLLVVITTAQLHSTKPELRFCAGSNPARRVRNSRWWGSLTIVMAGNKAKRFSSGNYTPKTIHHHCNLIRYISFAGCFIKQHNTVEYLGYQLDSKLRGEELASKVLRKINAKLKFIRKAYIKFLCLETFCAMR